MIGDPCFPCLVARVTGHLKPEVWAAMGAGPIRTCPDAKCREVWTGPEEPAPDAPLIGVRPATRATAGRPHSQSARQRNWGVGVLTTGPTS